MKKPSAETAQAVQDTVREAIRHGDINRAGRAAVKAHQSAIWACGLAKDHARLVRELGIQVEVVHSGSPGHHTVAVLAAAMVAGRRLVVSDLRIFADAWTAPDGTSVHLGNTLLRAVREGTLKVPGTSVKAVPGFAVDLLSDRPIGELSSFVRSAFPVRIEG